jgi:multiple sugar transport system permease protein
MNRRREWVNFLLMTGPALIGFAVFTAFPMLRSLWLSFTQYDGVGEPRFVGIDNYFYLFVHEPSFWPSIKVTALYTLFSVPLGLLASLGTALLLNARVRGIGVYRTIFFLPSILPATASGVLWVWIFHPGYGLLNTLLRSAGVDAPPAWTSSPTWALPALVIMSVWGFGGGMVVFLAGLQNVPKSLYEAAQIDGAGAWTQFRHVTLPQLSPVVFFNLVMGVIGAMKVFDSAYIFGAATGVAPGGPARATLFYVLNLYQKAFGYFHFGLASAMAWLLFIAVGLLTYLNFRAARRWVHHD